MQLFFFPHFDLLRVRHLSQPWFFLELIVVQIEPKRSREYFIQRCNRVLPISTGNSNHTKIAVGCITSPGNPGGDPDRSSSVCFITDDKARPTKSIVKCGNIHFFKDIDTSQDKEKELRFSIRLPSG